MGAVYKTIDDKGRVTLGRHFAGRMVEVEADDDAVVLKFRRVVPEREAWLWENESAHTLVARGLAEAQGGALSDGPDLGSSAAFADGIPDE